MTAERELQHLREICLQFPEAAEQETWGHPTFRVRGKIFATAGADDQGRVSMSAKSSEQSELLAAGDPFFYPSYVGSKGWIGVKLGQATDWNEISEIVEDSYRLIAPKRLVSQLDGPPSERPGQGAD